MYNRTEIVVNRRQATKARHKTIVTKQNQFYRDPEKQLEDARELAQAIAEARAVRLALCAR